MGHNSFCVFLFLCSPHTNVAAVLMDVSLESRRRYQGPSWPSREQTLGLLSLLVRFFKFPNWRVWWGGGGLANPAADWTGFAQWYFWLSGSCPKQASTSERDWTEFAMFLRNLHPALPPPPFPPHPSPSPPLLRFSLYLGSPSRSLYLFIPIINFFFRFPNGPPSLLF
jgi:hypothetical protein